MARVVKNDEMPTEHHKQKYTWKEWCDGQTRQLERGEDFEVSPEAFRRIGYEWAVRNGFKIEMKIRGKTVWLTGRPLSPEKSKG